MTINDDKLLLIFLKINPYFVICSWTMLLNNAEDHDKAKSVYVIENDMHDNYRRNKRLIFTLLKL